LHHDFRTRDGRDARFPAGMPKPTRVVLPKTGTFAQRRAALVAGPLGHLVADRLYYVAGTRLLIVAPSDPTRTSRRDVMSGEAAHGTGVVDSAIGARYGTAPDALAVYVAGSGAGAWNWVARQAWVDVASTSDYDLPRVAISSNDQHSLLCESADAVRRIVASGRIVFSSSGNTTDQPESLVSPNGLPEVFFVGGVDADGRTWRPGHPEESDPWYAAGNVVRPYDTGELFSFRAAAPDSFTGTIQFGGTSGATPRTAGWAAGVIAEARTAMGGTASRHAYAVGARRARGPLSDGVLTGPEVARLLRHVAVPAEPASPARYFVEGYGALGPAAAHRALDVIRGRAAEPARPDEDTAAASTRTARAAAFTGQRCALR
jgi:hypothetical protein